MCTMYQYGIESSQHGDAKRIERSRRHEQYALIKAAAPNSELFRENMPVEKDRTNLGIHGWL
jgi:hypothetical protein